MITHRCPRCRESIDSTIIEKKDADGKVQQKTRKLFYPIKDGQGNLIWKNLFHIDLVSLLLIITFLLLFLGVHQINEQCYSITENPCGWAREAGCNNLVQPEPDGEVIIWNWTGERQ